MGKLNHTFLLVFGPVLIVTGLAGMFGPAPWDLMSTAVPYNLLHIVFGVLGTAFALSRRPALIRGFNIGFGLIDLYQLVAHLEGWFPNEQFQWHRADDVLHLVLGSALVGIGLSRR